MDAQGAKRVPAVKKSVADARGLQTAWPHHGAAGCAAKRGAGKPSAAWRAKRPRKGKESKGKRAVKGMLAKRKERKRGWDPGAVGPRTMAEK